MYNPDSPRERAIQYGADKLLVELGLDQPRDMELIKRRLRGAYHEGVKKERDQKEAREFRLKKTLMEYFDITECEGASSCGCF